MSDRDDFLRAIADRQGDPLARLQFADWLEDEGRDPVGGCFQRVLAEPDRDDPRIRWADMVGGERGEFVAVQVELATLTDADGRPKPGWSELIERYHRKLCREDATLAAVKHRDALRRRERELLTSANALHWGPHRALWWNGCERPFCTMPGNDELVRRGFIGTQFTRGFVSVVTLSWADWLAHHAALLNAAPIRRVNRLRACGECQGQGCERIVPQRGGWPAACPACRGTGRVGAWVGGGRVVLTTWPVDVIPRPCGACADCTSNWPTGQCQAALDELDRHYRAVEFELPAARGVTVDFSALAGTEVEPGAGLRPGTIPRLGGRP